MPPIELVTTVRAVVFQNGQELVIKDADGTVHVTPVSEQIATLPDDEVLLRGSEEPVTPPEELLRAVQIGKAEAAAELLRPE